LNTADIWNVPNLISLLRLGMAPLMIGMAAIRLPNAVLGLFGLSLFSDYLDGRLARWLDEHTEIGAELDSLADAATYVAIAISAYWLWPAILRRESILIASALIVFVIPGLLGLIKFRLLPSYHTWSAKLAMVAVGISTLILFAGSSPWPFRCSLVILIVGSIEETLMTLILPQWTPDIPTFWHAVKISRRLKSGSSVQASDDSAMM